MPAGVSRWSNVGGVHDRHQIELFEGNTHISRHNNQSITEHSDRLSWLIDEITADQGCDVAESKSHKGLSYYTNSFWTAMQRQSHSIHEVSYRACFKAELPRFFIQNLTDVGSVVYDPFMGRGTTLIEAALLDRVPYGCDVNPLSIALVRPRLNPPSVFEVRERLAKMAWCDIGKPTNIKLLAFYHPTTLSQIEYLQQWLHVRERTEEYDYVDDWIKMVAISRLSGHSKGFFSTKTLPPNQAVTAKRQLLINAKLNQSPTMKNVPELILKKSRSLLTDRAPRSREFVLLTNSAWNTPEIPNDTVDLVVTSPPFLDTVNYVADNWLRCWFVGSNEEPADITQLKHLEDWSTFVYNTLCELHRVLKPFGYVAFEVGEVRKGSIQLDDAVVDAALAAGFHVRAVLVNNQRFTKTAHCWNVTNNQTGTNSNRVVLAQKLSQNA